MLLWQPHPFEERRSRQNVTRTPLVLQLGSTTMLTNSFLSYSGPEHQLHLHYLE
ncbi:hypothetical protein CBL_05671 [Carabus blaptoides fortunei]